VDYEDFLRQRGLPLWPGDDPRRKELVARRCQTADDLAGWVKQAAQAQHAELAELARQAARAADLSGQALAKPDASATRSIQPAPRRPCEGGASSLLARQIDAQAAAFENEGGFTERLYRVRTRRRGLAP
jgi:four helix bundle suffix protein